MDYTHLKKQLEERKREIEQRLIDNNHFGLERGFASDRASGELSQYDNHPADSGTELYEREKDMALLTHLEDERSEISYSLKQIEQGTYGICEKTGKKIPLERLEAVPTARTTRSAGDDHVAGDRPVEEDVLNDLEWNDGNDSYEVVANFNENGMTYEGSSLMDEEEDNGGYVEEFESFVSTDMNGYTGSDEVNFQRSEYYKEYMDQREQEDSE
ncbi:TraR/DksA C4-type zinc finger protein [Halobacillus shinanisalinarum]|uniref:TraR/DksA C4-type zinc finger protein n=1 Tax=Halobacillus shinanisalinarum TaxID=2932258 RepID=A0ABY4GWV1_9BACI|nr:TraR/DksA C4-type zinc finger protein [Halobacillus shinanisalinarum]UOQ92603.1 TraR/DksA C4-type zinc finger protein [Halobacillus shinanisalinarum]